MAFPVFFLYGQHFLVNFIIFIVSLTTGVLIIKKLKDINKALIYSSIVAIALLAMICVIFWIPARGWDYPYLSFIRTVYYFIPAYCILFLMLRFVKSDTTKYLLGILSLLIADFIIWILFIN